MTKLILFLGLLSGFAVNAQSLTAADSESSPTEAASIKQEKCLTGKCFSNVSDPNFPDSNTAQIVDGVFGSGHSNQGNPNGAKDTSDSI